MSRALLQSDDTNIFRHEVELSVGGVLVERSTTDSSSTASTTLLTHTPKTDSTVATRALVLARQVAGAAGTVGNSARIELLGTFRNVGGTVTQVGTTTTLATHRDSSEWNVTLTTDGTNVIVTAVLSGASIGADLRLTWNSYLYIHSLGGA